MRSATAAMSVHRQQCDWDKQLRLLLTSVKEGGGGYTTSQLSESALNLMLDDIILGVCFSIHRDARTGALAAEGLDDSVPAQFAVVDRVGLDVLGQPLVMKRPPDAQCPICSRSIACPRFAPHLEKCVGLGRNSSRLASRRIAVSNQQLMLADSGLLSDDEDPEWGLSPSLTTGGDTAAAGGAVSAPGYLAGGVATSSQTDRKRRRRDKLSPRRNKSCRRGGDKDSDTKSNPSNASSSTPSTPEHALQYEQLSEHERRSLFNQVCGVITESTRHVCTRSVRCSQHTDGQRRSVRAALFGSAQQHIAPSSAAVVNHQLLDGSALKHSLWRLWDRAGTTAPTVSALPRQPLAQQQTANTAKARSSRSRVKRSRPKCTRSDHVDDGLADPGV